MLKFQMDGDTQRTLARLRSDEARLESEITGKISEKSLVSAAIKAIEQLYEGDAAPVVSSPAPPRTRRTTRQEPECPLTMEERIATGDKYAALHGISRLMPDRVVHVRTAARWLIAAGLMPDHMDNARVSLTSHMKRRPDTWEQVGPGSFLLIATEEEA